MIKITTKGFEDAKEAEQIIIDCCRRWEKILPRQFRNLLVEWKPKQKVLAAISCTPEYRQAYMSISEKALNELDSTIIHEFCHVHFSPLHDMVYDKKHEASQEEMRKRIEECTTDLATVIEDLCIKEEGA